MSDTNMAELDDDELEAKSKAVNNAYTGMLAIALLALLLGCVLLYLDYSQYPETDPIKIESAPSPVTPAKGKTTSPE